MLETYGALSADLSIWRRTNITHGYVETVNSYHFFCAILVYTYP